MKIVDLSDPSVRPFKLLASSALCRKEFHGLVTHAGDSAHLRSFFSPALLFPCTPVCSSMRRNSKPSFPDYSRHPPFIFSVSFIFS